jgi:hypothetical protein
VDEMLKPLFWGRILRVVGGLVALYFALRLRGGSVGNDVFAALLALLGVSFIVGGVVANPGCEITALPNLFIAQEKRLYCA